MHSYLVVEIIHIIIMRMTWWNLGWYYKLKLLTSQIDKFVTLYLDASSTWGLELKILTMMLATKLMALIIIFVLAVKAWQEDLVNLTTKYWFVWGWLYWLGQYYFCRNYCMVWSKILVCLHWLLPSKTWKICRSEPLLQHGPRYAFHFWSICWWSIFWNVTSLW